MIKWFNIKGDPHIKGVSEMGIWYIRVNNDIVTAMYRMWGKTEKYIPSEGMTLDEAKEECEILTLIYIESTQMSPGIN